MLQFTGAAYGPPNQFGADAWSGAIEIDAEKNERDRSRKALEKFESLDLSKIDEQKDKAAVKNAGNQPVGFPGATMLPAELGKVYIGKLQVRDMRTGQPIAVAFKAVVEDLSSDSEPTEERQ